MYVRYRDIPELKPLTQRQVRSVARAWYYFDVRNSWQNHKLRIFFILSIYVILCGIFFAINQTGEKSILLSMAPSILGFVYLGAQHVILINKLAVRVNDFLKFKDIK